MELTELVRGAQEAMDRGEYHVASSACTHVLEAYPNCLSARRILGESLLEQGQTKPAIDHFERVLALDPLNVVARLGLGVASEELKEPGLAYAYYLHAWELNPALDQVRNQLVRLRATLGSHDRLHPTRAGLAGIHARSGQFGRAAAEWRAILAVDPDSSRAQTSLAEVHWRAGDDAAAVTLCKGLLEQTPDNARALAILAEIEKRQGSSTSEEWVRRYQAIDPIGEVAQLMIEYRPNTDFSFLTAAPSEIADFDFATVAADQPTTTTSSGAATPNPALAASHVAAPDLWDSLVRDMSSDGSDEANGEGNDLQPFSWSDDRTESDLPPTLEPFSLDGFPDVSADLVAEQPMVQPIVVPAPALDVQPTIEPADYLLGFEAIPVAEVAPVSDPFITADGRVDLTIGWDEIDRVLQEATPSDAEASGYDDLLAELDAGGMAPFSADEGTGDNSAWEPFTADDFGDAPSASAAIAEDAVPTLGDDVIQVAPAATSWPMANGEDLAAIAADGDDDIDFGIPAGWDDLEEALISAIPSPQPSGYTELLRHIDNEELSNVADLTSEEIDPLLNPDATGDPLDFEALATVTSRDGTSELRSLETVTEQPQPTPFAIEDLIAGQSDSHAGDTLEMPLDLPAFVWEDDESLAAEGDIEAAPDRTSQPAKAMGIGELDEEFGAIAPFSFDDDVAVGDYDPVNGMIADHEHQEAFSDALAASAPIDGDSVGAAPLVSRMPEAQEPFDWTTVVANEPTPESMAEPQQAWLEASVEEGASEDLNDAIRWPTFIGHSPELVDREPIGLFTRLRAQKRAMEADGMVIVDRTIMGRASATIASIPAGQELPNDQFDAMVRPTSGPRLATIDGFPVDQDMSDLRDLDLTRMRIRLIESETAAAEIAATLEAAIARGETQPLTLRVLGEAYLRLGRTEQAAAQFRESMLARRRAR